MRPAIRKFALTTHVTSSIGWLGAVAAFLLLAVVGLASRNPQTVRAAYISMESITWGVIVPFSLASLATGIVQSLGTPWGLLRHYWIVAKLGLTVLATAILLAHTQPIERVASLAVERALSSADLYTLRVRLIADAGAAVVALLIATTLSVYKPWGMTTYGRRSESVVLTPERSNRTSPFWTTLWLAGLFLAVALFVLAHLARGGFNHH